MTLRILIVETYYPEFLGNLYDEDSRLADLEYEEQLSRVFDAAFGVGDAYSNGLRSAGCDAREVICNADILQFCWAREHGLAPLPGNIHDQRRQIVAAQVAEFRPDVILVFEWCPLGDAFLMDLHPCVRLLVGQISSPLPTNRTFAAFDLMLSSWPPIVDFFRREGRRAEPLKLAFDERILGRLESVSDDPPGPSRSLQADSSAHDSRCPQYDVTFVGGFAVNHADRIAWLERLLGVIDVEVFGYGLAQTPPDSIIRNHHRGAVWGLRMYEVLRQSRITLNYHANIDIRGSNRASVAANMRLYEATGVGTCLITEAKDNLHEMFEPRNEVVVFRDEAECIAKVQYYLDHDLERKEIARAGQERTLRDHTYTVRMKELLAILTRFL